MNWKPIPYSQFQHIPINADDDTILAAVHCQLMKGNKDNISRTHHYLKYYSLHPEIGWSFLASMVSRNAGWNMCDLYGPVFSKLLDELLRKRLLLTYERANWLIFRDAYPQLLLYHYSTRLSRSLFHLFKHFHISSFMEDEWKRYWNHRDGKRLMYSLIINEQHVIHRPVIEHPLYKKRVFVTPLFFLQELLHMNCVIFPTLGGELYGSSVVHFRNVVKRIELGKKLAAILFHDDLYPLFIKFALHSEHTGSRADYEKYFDKAKRRETPYLRTVVPYIQHHVRETNDWSKRKVIKQEWLEDPHEFPAAPLTNWYLSKQKQIHLFYELKNFFD